MHDNTFIYIYIYTPAIPAKLPFHLQDQLSFATRTILTTSSWQICRVTKVSSNAAPLQHGDLHRDPGPHGDEIRPGGIMGPLSPRTSFLSGEGPSCFSQVEKLSRSVSWKKPSLRPLSSWNLSRRIEIYVPMTSNDIQYCYIHDVNSPLVLFFAFCRQMEFHDDLVPATPRNLEEGKSMTWDVKDALGLMVCLDR